MDLQTKTLSEKFFFVRIRIICFLNINVHCNMNPPVLLQCCMFCALITVTRFCLYCSMSYCGPTNSITVKDVKMYLVLVIVIVQYYNEIGLTITTSS